MPIDSQVKQATTTTNKPLMSHEGKILLSVARACGRYGLSSGARLGDIQRAVMDIWRSTSRFTEGVFVCDGWSAKPYLWRSAVNGLLKAGYLSAVTQRWYDEDGRARGRKPHYSITAAGIDALGRAARSEIRGAIMRSWPDYGGPEESARRRPKVAVALSAVDVPKPEHWYERNLRLKREERRAALLAKLTDGLDPANAARVLEIMKLAPAPEPRRVGRRRRKHGRGENCMILAVARAAVEVGGTDGWVHSGHIQEAYMWLDRRVGLHYILKLLAKLQGQDYLAIADKRWWDKWQRIQAPRHYWKLTAKGTKYAQWVDAELKKGRMDGTRGPWRSLNWGSEEY